ncbi:MAG: DUF481 domain-containing protein, partial [Pseudomonadota bacterium]
MIVIRLVVLTLLFQFMGVLSAHAQQSAASPALLKLLANAAQTGDAAILQTTLDLALQAEPEAAESLIRQALHSAPDQETALLDHLLESQPDLAGQVVLPGQITITQRREAIAAEEAAKPLPGFFDLSSWSGDVSLGGSVLSGNTEETAINAGLTMKRAVADWEYNFALTADYSRNNDATTKQRLLSNFGT